MLRQKEMKLRGKAPNKRENMAGVRWLRKGWQDRLS